jgi:hypothetical protein
VSFVIDDPTYAPVIIIESGLKIITIRCLAVRIQPVAIDTDVAAGLAIGTTRAITPPAVSISISVSIRVYRGITAAQLSIDVGNGRLAAAEAIELGLLVIALRGLAPRVDCIETHAYVLAGLSVVPGWASLVFIANEVPFHIGDISYAPINVVKRRLPRVAIRFFTPSNQPVAFQPCIPASFQIRAGWSVRPRGMSCTPEKEQGRNNQN